MSLKHKPKILHVDDDEANRYSVKLILQRAGYEVIEAETGREGLRLAEENPDLIILDIRLPDINGYEITRVLKMNPKLSSIPVLQTSASFVTSEHKVEGLESGADGYLAQPIDNAVLVATVKSLLRIRAAEKMATDARRAQEETLAIVSHDLRNPLATVLLQAKIAVKSIEKGESAEQQIPKLEKIAHSCRRMNKLIEDLLIVANIESGKLALQKSITSINEVFDELYLSFEELAAQKQIRLIRELGGKKEHTIFVDRDRILQVFENFISNALRFTSPGGSIELGAEENESAYVFHVKDTGAGMNQDMLPHIFDRYWQGHKDRSTGVGLGLSIVKGIIEAHDGSVWVESELGKGTTFFFILPK